VFLLEPAHLSSPGQRAVKRLLLLCCWWLCTRRTEYIIYNVWRTYLPIKQQPRHGHDHLPKLPLKRQSFLKIELSDSRNQYLQCNQSQRSICCGAHQSDITKCGYRALAMRDHLLLVNFRCLQLCGYALLLSRTYTTHV